MKLTAICLGIATSALVGCSAAAPVETSPEPALEDEEQEATVARRIGSPHTSSRGPLSERPADAGLTPEQLEEMMARMGDGGALGQVSAILGDCEKPDAGCDVSAFEGIGGIGDPPAEQTDD